MCLPQHTCTHTHIHKHTVHTHIYFVDQCFLEGNLTPVSVPSPWGAPGCPGVCPSSLSPQTPSRFKGSFLSVVQPSTALSIIHLFPFIYFSWLLPLSPFSLSSPLLPAFLSAAHFLFVGSCPPFLDDPSLPAPHGLRWGCVRSPHFLPLTSCHWWRGTVGF